MPVPAISLTNENLTAVSADWLIVGVEEQKELSSGLKDLDQALGGAINQLLERKEFRGKLAEVLYLPVPSGIAASRLLLVGLGCEKALTVGRLEQALMTAVRRITSQEPVTVAISISEAASQALGADIVATQVITSSIVGSTPQTLYKAEQDRRPFKQVTLVQTVNAAISDSAVERGQIIGEAMNLTRQLVNRHPEDLYPETFADFAANVAADLGIQGEIFDGHRLKQERMNSLLAVARGSHHDPRLVLLKYEGAGPDAPVLALCGKGVTFDSGGLSIKPSESMISMKADMAGAATVLGAMTAIARLKLPVNVMGVMGLVENMLGAHCYKLGEVLTARNGTTIEVHNTDAEGRLVLADVLCYTAEQKPAKMIDLATLTGACIVALGEEIAGVFTNDQQWCDDVVAASKRAGEEVWQLPMHDRFGEQLKADFADIKNVGKRWGGAITAAKFLEKFVDETPWVHLDIAGPSYAEAARPYCDAGGTAALLRTLLEVAEAFSKNESK